MIKGALIALAVIMAFLFLLWRLYFLRNTKREIAKNGIVSPADGTISDIIYYEKPEVVFKKGNFGRVRAITREIAPKGYIVGIFMSLADVHYQRAPVTGVVTLNKHFDGKFKIGFDFVKSLQNEMNEIMIRGENSAVKVVQTAGFLARRIETYVKEGQHVEKGEVIGRINLGSHVTLVVPDISLKARKGDKVKAGVTVIAD